MRQEHPDVTLLLGELTRGRPDAAEKLIPLVYNELRRLARGTCEENDLTTPSKPRR